MAGTPSINSEDAGARQQEEFCRCLTMLEIADWAPREALLIGIAPEKTAFGPIFSGPVQTAIPTSARPRLEVPVAERC